MIAAEIEAAAEVLSVELLKVVPPDVPYAVLMCAIGMITSGAWVEGPVQPMGRMAAFDSWISTIRDTIQQHTPIAM